MPGKERGLQECITVSLCLSLQIEKVLQQGDISDAAEPYLKSRDLDKKSLDKFKLQANFFCQQLGEYRMPFAWTAINVLDIIAGNQASTSSGSAAVSSPDPRQSVVMREKDRDSMVEKGRGGTPEPAKRRDTRTGSISSLTAR